MTATPSLLEFVHAGAASGSRNDRFFASHPQEREQILTLVQRPDLRVKSMDIYRWLKQHHGYSLSYVTFNRWLHEQLGTA